jgi:hypothetical protein
VPVSNLEVLMQFLNHSSVHLGGDLRYERISSENGSIVHPCNLSVCKPARHIFEVFFYNLVMKFVSINCPLFIIHPIIDAI